MIEVFKTNVCNQYDAHMLIEQIERSFFNYQANFDLQDCDCILRVKSASGIIQAALIIDLLKGAGFDAEVLPDHIPVTRQHPLPSLPAGS